MYTFTMIKTCRVEEEAGGGWDKGQRTGFSGAKEMKPGWGRESKSAWVRGFCP